MLSRVRCWVSLVRVAGDLQATREIRTAMRESRKKNSHRRRILACEDACVPGRNYGERMILRTRSSEMPYSAAILDMPKCVAKCDKMHLDKHL